MLFWSPFLPVLPSCMACCPCKAAALPCAAARPIPPSQPCPFCPCPSSARSPLPKPVGDDFQCAVAATPHTLLAVGGVERAGLLAKQRGIWQYNAHEGTWTRAG